MTEPKFEWFACNPSKMLSRLIGLKSTQALIYMVVIMRIYEEDGPCTDSARALGQRVGLDARTVQTALNTLLKTGKLWKAERGGLMEDSALDELIERRSRAEDHAKIAQPSAKIPQSKQQNGSRHRTENNRQSLGLFGRETRAREEGSANLADWTPSQEYFKYAESELNLTEAEVRAEAEKFRNHYLAKGVSWPNPGPKFKNWLFQASIYKIRDAEKAGKNAGPDFYDVAMGRANGQRHH